MAQQIERRTTSVYKRYIEHSEQSSYIEIPFQMPPDVEEIHVSYQVDSHGGDPAKAVIDLGIRDAEIVRGWSGGARQNSLSVRIQPLRVICPDGWPQENGLFSIMPTRCPLRVVLSR